MTDFRRDRAGRPIVLLPDGSEATYERASKLGSLLEDRFFLERWSTRMLLRGVIVSDHVARLLSLTDPSDDQALDRIARRARDEAGAGDAADVGTAVHRLLELLDTDAITLDEVDPRHHRLVEVYRSTLEEAGLRPVDAEVLTITDEWRTAGSADRIFERPDGSRVIGDLKTGARLYSRSLSIPVQIATYASGLRYDPTTGRRTEIPDLDRSVGLVIHLPAGASTPTCDLWSVDVEATIPLCRLADGVRRARDADDLLRRLSA